MIRGFYTAVTGLKTAVNTINVAGNNITNSQTAGFKKDGVVCSSFDQYLTYKTGNGPVEDLGGMTHGVILDQVYTGYQQGAFKQTGSALDFAIEGDGFFTVQTADRQIKLTRNGRFLLNENGYLTDSSGNLVLGNNGPINVGRSDISISSTGEVFAGGQSIGQLRITCPTNLSALVKEEGTLFSYNGDATVAFQGKIHQGVLESSNVDLTDEMTDIMAYSRSYQSCSQIIKMIDQITEKTVNEIARL